MARSIQTEDFIMRAMSRRATRYHLNRPGERLSDGVGGTITGTVVDECLAEARRELAGSRRTQLASVPR